MSESETARAVEKISERVRSHWEAKRQGLLLSQLGQYLLGEGIDLKQAFHGKKLGQFIEESMTDLKILLDPANPIIRVVLPKGVEAGQNEYRFFPNKRQEAPPRQLAEFKRAVTSAFTKSLAPTNLRWLMLGALTRFSDQVVGLAPPPGYKEVASNYIVDIGSFDDLDEAHRQLVTQMERWAKDNSVNFDDLLHAPRTARSTSASDSTLLHRLIEALGQDEMKRVTLPLDIVATMLKQR